MVKQICSVHVMLGLFTRLRQPECHPLVGLPSNVQDVILCVQHMAAWTSRVVHAFGGGYVCDLGFQDSPLVGWTILIGDAS